MLAPLHRTVRQRAGRLIGACLILGLATASVSVASSQVAEAATDVVTNCSGSISTPGSLPYVVSTASSGDIITFALSPACSTITLTSQLLITGLTITGPAPGTLAVSGGGTTNVFAIGNEPTAVSGLTIEDGYINLVSGGGGAIQNYGTLTVSNCTFVNNTSVYYGGAIFNNNSLTVTDSTFSNNTAAGGASRAGAIFNGSAGTAAVSDSTFSGNSSVGGAGALYSDGTLNVVDCTFFNNVTSSYGGGLENSGGGTATVVNSTFSDNSAPAGEGGGIFTTAR